LLISILVLRFIYPNPVLIEEMFGLMAFNLLFVLRLIIIIIKTATE
jgi:hypothetical protein